MELSHPTAVRPGINLLSPRDTMCLMSKVPEVAAFFLLHVCSVESNAGGIQHDTNFSSNALGRQVPAELAPDNAVRPVRAAHPTPIDAELGPVLSRRGTLGDEGDALSEVEFSVLLRIHALNLDQGGVVVLVTEAALVTEDGPVDIEACRLSALTHLFVVFQGD
eukprot:CAMPEP_0183291926 /NCGR_PEP_ID=MMETSP0160_2-20130417/1175_1 /TAXON_ID=2839 ORGANISM="Odontella Sinensis, Strain Grunow 1884" /NCGR_SAMPLE_ID=MMETSP0160_2 /ASSEMBLY_ACC=CAM_ASM_000250 /LENGTH=163 /DNA_ID=CAMNT_0025452807 /DNA_START=130 /DNA_END=622 /DNA_ORIENTATION=-